MSTAGRVASGLRAALAVSVALGCAGEAAIVGHPPAPRDAASDVLDAQLSEVADAASPVDVEAAAAMDAAGKDAASDDVTEAPDAPPPRRVIPPTTRALREVVGFALPGRDLPTGAGAAAVARRRWVWDTLRDLGVRRVRTEIFWRTVEPRAGEFRWDAYDPMVAEMRTEGVAFLAVLAYGNAWASSAAGATDFHPPDDPRTFARYATEVARRYGDHVRDWEVWNEPNAGFRFWRSRAGGDPRAFGALVAATEAAVRAVRPDARVAFGGTVFLPQVIPGGVAFTRDAFAANPGLASALGAFAMHTYTLYPPRVGPESDAPRELSQVAKVQEMAAAIEGAGFDLRRPMWITEVGWPVTTTITEALQARYLVRAVLLAAFSGVDGVWLYELGDGPSRVDDLVPEDSFGIFRYDADPTDATPPAPKPAFHALRGLLSSVGAMRVVARESPGGAPGDVHVLALQGDGSARGWVAWRADDAAAPWPWRPPTGELRAMDGSPLTASPDGTVSLGGAPVYVIAR